MPRFVIVLALLVLGTSVVGCSGDSDKGLLKHKEKAVPPPAQSK